VLRHRIDDVHAGHDPIHMAVGHDQHAMNPRCITLVENMGIRTRIDVREQRPFASRASWRRWLRADEQSYVQLFTPRKPKSAWRGHLSITRQISRESSTPVGKCRAKSARSAGACSSR
jgi:hypothetical protein